MQCATDVQSLALRFTQFAKLLLLMMREQMMDYFYEIQFVKGPRAVTKLRHAGLLEAALACKDRIQKPALERAMHPSWGTAGRFDSDPHSSVWCLASSNSNGLWPKPL